LIGFEKFRDRISSFIVQGRSRLVGYHNPGYPRQELKISFSPFYSRPNRLYSHSSLHQRPDHQALMKSRPAYQFRLARDSTLSSRARLNHLRLAQGPILEPWRTQSDLCLTRPQGSSAFPPLVCSRHPITSSTTKPWSSKMGHTLNPHAHAHDA